jgi:hypothetical protein
MVYVIVQQVFGELALFHLSQALCWTVENFIGWYVWRGQKGPTTVVRANQA